MQQSGEEIISLIDEIEEIISQGRTPFGGGAKKTIEPQEIYEILDEIRDRYPSEFQEARKIIKERNEIIALAQQQANSIIVDAQQQAVVLASDQEVVRLAQQQAEDIRNQAQAYERDTRFSAEEYADSVLAHLEDNLKSITSQVSRVRQTLDENAQAGSQNLGW